MAEKKKKKRGQQGSKTMLYVLLGGGVVLLGLCCIGGSIAGVFTYLAMPGDPEKEIVGRWQFDRDYGHHVSIGEPPPTLQFNQDGSFELIPQNPAGQIAKGKWKTTSKKGNAIAVEVAYTFVTPLATRTVRISFELLVVSHDVLHKRIHHAIHVNGEPVQNDSGQRYKRI